MLFSPSLSLSLSIYLICLLLWPPSVLLSVCTSASSSVCSPLVELSTCLLSFSALRHIGLSRCLSEYTLSMYHAHLSCLIVMEIWITHMLSEYLLSSVCWSKKVPLSYNFTLTSLHFYYAAHSGRKCEFSSYLYSLHCCSDPWGPYFWWLVMLLIEEFKHIWLRKAPWKSLWIKLSLTCPLYDFLPFPC